MALSISAVVLLAIIVFILIKKSGLKAPHAIICILLGFYLASSTIAPVGCLSSGRSIATAPRPRYLRIFRMRWQ